MTVNDCISGRLVLVLHFLSSSLILLLASGLR